MKNRILWFALILGIGLVNTQCGSKAKSAKVSVDISPDVPIVITGDLKIGTRTVKAPWFAFQATLTNDSNETVTVMAIEMTITAVSTSGAFITNQVTVTPGDFSVSYTCPNNPEITLQLTFTDFGEYLAGESKQLFVQYRGIDISTCTGSDTPAAVKFYIGNNPSLAAGAADYSYSVQATVVGWFGGVSNPTDRFSKDLYFSTQ